MSKYKRSISVLLAVLMVFGVLTVGALAAEAESLPFTDVASGDWFFGAVQYVYQQGIMTGIDETTFAPNAPLTRAMVVATLFRIYHGRSADAGDWRSSSFTDVHSDQWFAPYVAWAHWYWIVEGLGDGRFAPDDYVDRQQFAVMLYRYADRMTDRDTSVIQGWQWNHFTDRDQIASWAVAGLVWVNYHNIITGRTPTTIVPGGTVIRAEAATMLMRLIEGAETLYHQAAEDLLIQLPTLFSLGRERNDGELYNFDGTNWFDQYGNSIEPPAFLIHYLIPINYSMYALCQDEPPTIFVLFGSLNSCERMMVVYRFIDGEYQKTTSGTLVVYQLFRDSAGRVILHYNSRFYGYHDYYYLTFSGTEMILDPIITNESWEDESGSWHSYFRNHITGERLPFENATEETGWFCEAWERHHASTPAFIFGMPNETLTPIHPLTDLQDSINASVRARLGLE